MAQPLGKQRSRRKRTPRRSSSRTGWPICSTQWTKNLDEKTKVKVMAGCGRGCFRRHQFKQDIARMGQGQRRRIVGSLQEELRGLARRRRGSRPVRCSEQAVLLPGRTVPSGATPRHALRVHARHAPDGLRDGAGPADQGRDCGVPKAGRQDVPLRGPCGMTGRLLPESGAEQGWEALGWSAGCGARPGQEDGRDEAEGQDAELHDWFCTRFTAGGGGRCLRAGDEELNSVAGAGG